MNLDEIRALPDDAETDARILCYATTYADDGLVILEDVPLTDPPDRFPCSVQDGYARVRSREISPGVWEHRYYDRLAAREFRTILRSVGAPRTDA